MTIANRATELLGTSLGNYGSIEITGTSKVEAPTGYHFIAFYVVADAVVSTATDIGTSNADLSAFTVLTAGMVFYGKWADITLTSGEMCGYYGSR